MNTPAENNEGGKLRHFFTHWTWKKVILWIFLMAIVRFIFAVIMEGVNNGW